MGIVRNFVDGITNALTGIGSTTDPRSYNRYFARYLSPVEIDQAYRGSWLCRKIIDKPAEEMVREWRDWQGDAKQIEALEAEEKRLDIRNKVKRAEVMRGLGGGGMVLWIDGDDQTKPIDATKVRLGGLTAVHVWHHSRFGLGPMIDDWKSPWFGYPSYFTVSLASGQQQFHPSRVVAFRGKPVSDIIGAAGNTWFWGESTVQVVLDAVSNFDTAQNGFAALIKDARNRRLSVPGLTARFATADGEALFARRAQALAAGESSLGITFLDAGSADGKGGETLTDRQMVWSGIPDIGNMYAAAAAGAADMPATVLFGKSPDGMNATGASDLAIWEKTVKARQDLELRPCLAQLDAALVPSALGKLDPTIWYQFAPLSTLSEKDEAATFLATMQATEKLQQSGTIPDVPFSKGMQNLVTERGWMPGLDAALAEIPEAERFPELAEPETDASGNPIDTSALQTKGGDQFSAGAGGAMEAPPRRRAANDARFADATPRSLYVRRDVVNVADLKAWARKQGLPDLQDGLHVTIVCSRTPLDWMKIDGEWNADADGNITVPPGGVRIVEPLGNRTAVLLFTSSALAWRHESILRAGAQSDYPEYQPHISLTGDAVDLAGVEPYRGKIVLGPEIFEEVRSEGE